MNSYLACILALYGEPIVLQHFFLCLSSALWKIVQARTLYQAYINRLLSRSAGRCKAQFKTACVAKGFASKSYCASQSTLVQWIMVHIFGKLAAAMFIMVFDS